MTSVMRVARGCAMLLALAAVAVAGQQKVDMKTAVDLYDQQEYEAAQEILLKLDVEKLSDAEKSEREQMLKLLPEAIAGSKKASQDKADADRAMSLGDLDGAEKLYVAVTRNNYARPALRESAAQALEQVAEKRRLTANSAAARPADEPAGEVVVMRTMAQDPAGQPVDGSAPPPQTIVSEMQSRDALLWQRAEAVLDDMARRSREAADRGDWNQAYQFYGFAEQAIESAKPYAEPVSRYEAARVRLNTLKADLDDRQQAAQRIAADEERAEVERRIREREELYARQKQEQIERLFEEAQQFRREQRLAEAVHVLREILLLDPGNEKAQNQLEIYQDFESLMDQKDIETDADRESRNALVKAQEAKIAWDYNMLYPKNWLEITARRQGAGVGRLSGSDEDRELERSLTETIEVNWESLPLETAVEYLKEDRRVNISVEWDDLAAAGIDRDKPISMSFTKVKFGRVLRELVDQVSSDTPVQYRIVDGVIRIATKERLDREKFTQIYDVRDLIVAIPRFLNAPTIDQNAVLNNASTSVFSGGRNSLFADAPGDEGTDSVEHNGIGDPKEIAKLLDVVRSSVAPDSWRETGTGDGSLRELNGNIIVYNTSDAHQQVSDLLRQLRESRALQIAMETRFLTLSNNYLEEIGVDLDFVLNQGSAEFDRAFSTANGVPTPLFDPYSGAPLLLPRQYGAAGVTPAVPPFGVPLTPGQALLQPYGNVASVPYGTGIPPQFNNTTPIPITNGSATLTNPRNLNTGVPNSWAERAGLNPAFNLTGTYLDNLQVDFLIRATQANQRSTIVQAPRLMMFNGQRANISVGRNQQYVSSVRPQLAEGVVGYTPIPANAFSGTSLDVEGVISADRKYVTVTVRTAQLKEPRFTDYQVTQASGNSPGVFIRLLDQETTSINTTVSIPDGGTVLMGGIKQVGEIEVEAGVPVLSKIPVLKRAFTNSTTVKDTQTILILMKTSIIIQKEAEDEAFPTMTDTEFGS